MSVLLAAALAATAPAAPVAKPVAGPLTARAGRGAYFTGGRCQPGDPAGRAEGLHVPSPDWRAQIIYSVQLDRFNDGDPSRNELGQGEYDPTRADSYSGGDIPGLIARLDYLKSLGVTTILLSPIIANKWRDPGLGDFPPYTGYHGYWPVGYRDVDAHLGSMEDLRRLSSEVHRRGMYLMMDAVINHSAHYYHYSGRYDPDNVSVNFNMLAGQWPERPLDPPFDQNDLRNPAHRAADSYHWTPPISDYDDPAQVERYQLELVNDLNTSNPRVRSALKSAYACWLEQVGFDGIRFDAAKHVEREFWADFLDGPDGLKAAARKLGRGDLLTYGEIWRISPPFSDEAERFIAAFMASGQEPGVGTAMGFPLFSSMNKVINVGKRTDILGYTLDAQLRAYPDPNRVINFLDSHDVDRFLVHGDEDRYHKALAVLLTAPGIPFLYQGSEQGLTQTRQAMFAGGFASPRGHFNPDSDLYRVTAALTRVRTAPGGLFTHGSFKVLATNPIGPGLFAFERRTERQAGFVLINTAAAPTLVNALPTGLKPGTRLRIAHGKNFAAREIVVNAAGVLNLVLPGDAIAILVSETDAATGSAPQPPQIRLDPLDLSAALTEDRWITGQVEQKSARLRLSIDGNFGAAQSFRADADGKFRVRLPVHDMGAARHFFEIALADGSASAAPVFYMADRTAQRSSRSDDPPGDDRGPAGSYAKPLHPTFKGQMDIRGLEARVAGNQLMLRLTMAEVTDRWSYPNGFENAALHVFIDDRKVRSGSTALPWISAAAPAGFDWDAVHMLHGFTNYIYRNRRGAAVQRRGPLPDIAVDGNTITVRYDCAQLQINCGNPLKIYVSTWDRDGQGKLRDLAAQPGLWAFGGPTRPGALILDDASVTVP